MKDNYFNLNDLKSVTNLHTARVIIATCQRYLAVKRFMVQSPTINRGKPTTHLINMNHYDLNQAMEYFSQDHKLESVRKSRKKKLRILRKLKKDK